MKTNLIATVSLAEDLDQNSEGFDKQVLTEAVQVTEFSEPTDGATLLMQLMEEGLL